MKSILSTLLLLFFFHTVAAQVQEYRPLASSMQIIERVEEDSKKIDGSTYLEDEFKSGLLTQKENKTNNLYFRFNALSKQVEIKIDLQDKEIYVLPKSYSDKYKLQDYEYQFRQLDFEDDGLITGYYLVYYENENLLFIGKPVLNHIKEVEKKSGFGASKPARYDVEIQWFLSKKETELIQIKLRNKDLEKFFESQSVEDYLADHKIKSELDVVRMLEFFEENNF